MRMLAVFEKSERVRHIGHLDIMRTVGRALRRTALPVSYSKGFSPHVLLSFASALSVGAVGRRELMDVTLDEDVSADFFVSEMNRVLPQAIRVLEARPLPERHPALMAQVAGADYLLHIRDEGVRTALAAALPGFLQQEEIITQRKTKSGVKPCDIRPLIYQLREEDNGLRAVLALTERESCKPDMLLKALCAYAGVTRAEEGEEPALPRMLVERLSLLGAAEDGTLVPLETL